MRIRVTLKLSPPSYTPTLGQNPAVFYIVWLSEGCVPLTTLFFFSLKVSDRHSFLLWNEEMFAFHCISLRSSASD